MPVIDYARMQKSSPKLKVMLTRATKQTDPLKRYNAVLAACKAAVTEWNAVGAWVDAWARWQIALDDAFYNLQCSPQWRAAGTPAYFPPRLKEL